MRAKQTQVIVFTLWVLLFALLAQGLSQQDPQVAPTEPRSSLTNQDIIALLHAGLSAEVLLAKIKSSPCDFDTSPAALQELKAAQVPDSIILAMVERMSSPPVAVIADKSPKEAAPKFAEVTVPDGTLVEVELKATVSSEDVEEGSVIDFAVVQPVIVNGVEVIERGAPAKARVAEVKKARRWGRAGKIAWAMQDGLALDGTRVPLRFTKEAEGGGSSGKVAAAIVATSIVFWPAAPIWGLKKGKPAVMPAGKRYEVFVHGETKVKGKPVSAEASSPTPVIPAQR